MTVEQQRVASAANQATLDRNIVDSMSGVELLFWKRDALDQAAELVAAALDAAGSSSPRADLLATVQGAAAALDRTSARATAGAVTDAGTQVAQAIARLASDGDALGKLVAELPGPAPGFADVAPDASGNLPLEQGHTYRVLLVVQGTPGAGEVASAIAAMGFGPPGGGPPLIEQLQILEPWPAAMPSDWPVEPLVGTAPSEMLVRAMGRRDAAKAAVPALVDLGSGNSLRVARVWDWTPGVAASPPPPVLPPPPPPPYAPPVGAPATSPPRPSTTPLALAAKGLLYAYRAKHGGAEPPPVGISLAFSWSLLEGAWTGYFKGTNNYGSMHATKRFERAFGKIPGYGMVAFLDGSGGGHYYVARMIVAPSLAIGGGLYLDTVEGMVQLGSVASETDYATQLYVGGYYAGRHEGRTPVPQRKDAAAAGQLNAADQANIADGAAALTMNLARAQQAIAAAGSEPGDPTVRTSGPPFASLGDRLTPSPAYKPHTVDHARELLGDAADNPPPGAISIADALAAPGHDGVWLFGPEEKPPGPPLPEKPPSGMGWGAIALAAGVALVAGASAAVMGGHVHGG